MNETKNDYRQKSDHTHRPYWQRAHHDWKFWVGLVLMLTAMVIYVTSNNLAGWRGDRPQQPASVAPGM
jgi:hypothetical protein